MSKRKYITLLKIGMQTSMEYKTNFILGLLTTFFPMIINMFVWYVIYQDKTNTVLFGYTYSQMIMYTVLAGLVSTLVSTNLASEMSNDIVTGELNKFLAQPISYFWYRVSNYFGVKLFHSTILSACGAVVIVIMVNKYQITLDIVNIGLAIIAIIFSVFLNFTIFYIVGMSGFYITNVGYLYSAVQALFNIASGGVFPLSIFGKSICRVLNVLPFQYIVYFPLNIINGKLSKYEIYIGLLTQIMWIFVLVILSRIFWRKGIKKYVGVGG